MNQIISKPDHPFEVEAVRLTKQYIEKVKFPLSRINLEVIFDCKYAHPSWHQMKINLNENGLPEGEITVFYDLLNITQDPALFLNDIVPHELAHVLAYVEAFKNDIKIKDHGSEWQSWLLRLNSSAATSAKPGANIWDDRAIMLNKGGLCVKCKCDGDGFSVLPSTRATENKLRNKDIVCSICNAPYVASNMDEMPEKVSQALDYIKQEKTRRI